MPDAMDKFIEDIIKGAADSFTGGRRVPGERLGVQRDVEGREEKLANHAGLGALAGGLMLPGIGAPVGAALGADEGQRGTAAIGSVLGGVGGAGLGALGGGGLGALLGLLAHNPQLGTQLGAGAGAGIGGIGGMMYGAQHGGEGEKGIADHVKNKLGEAMDAGAKTAAAKFGLKEALFPGLAQKVLSAAGQLGHGLQTGAEHIAPGIPAGWKRRLVSGVEQLGAGMHAATPQILQGFKDAETKEAFLPFLGSLAGPALARAGIGAMARRGAGSAVGGMANRLLPKIGGGFGGMAFDAAASMAGDALGNRMQQPQAIAG